MTCGISIEKPLFTLSRVFTRLLLSTAFFSLHFASQSQTNISGVVNTYHRVTEVIPSLACVRVNDATGLSTGVKVMLIQMKGASINTTSSSSSFGDTTSLNNAGNYEIGTVCVVREDS